MMKKVVIAWCGLAIVGSATLAQAQTTSPRQAVAAPAIRTPARNASNCCCRRGAGPSRQGRPPGGLREVGARQRAVAQRFRHHAPASPGDALGAVDRIVTGPDSSASVVLRDDTTLVVGPSSRLDLKEFHFDGTTHEGGMLVSLLRGSMRMITGLIGKTNPDAVRVETQTATIGIRGTDFIVQADAQP
jgi:ferric-dicitrate binding protein FerR (iron transport regulator)